MLLLGLELLTKKDINLRLRPTSTRQLVLAGTGIKRMDKIQISSRHRLEADSQHRYCRGGNTPCRAIQKFMVR